MSDSNNLLSTPFGVCSFPDCERQAQKRSGLCLGHRNQQKQGKELKGLPLTRKEVLARWGGECRLDFCASDTWVKGYCKYHYSQYARGKPFKVRTGIVQRRQECGFGDCDRISHSRGLCSTHAKQKRDGLELTEVPRAKLRRGCEYVGCDLEMRSKGYCASHYGQLRRTGRAGPLRDYFTPDRKCGVSWCHGGANHRGTCKFHQRQMNMYTLDLERLETLVHSGVCSICHQLPENSKNLHIDHDHSCCSGTRSCGKCVRGAVCSRCNLVLGRVGDSPELLIRMSDYLQAGGCCGFS